jgi:hypothetical protein
LCRFLGKPIPNRQFPHLNRSNTTATGMRPGSSISENAAIGQVLSLCTDNNRHAPI